MKMIQSKVDSLLQIAYGLIYMNVILYSYIILSVSEKYLIMQSKFQTGKIHLSPKQNTNYKNKLQG